MTFALALHVSVSDKANSQATNRRLESRRTTSQGSEDGEVGVHLHDELSIREHADVAVGL